MEPFPTLETGRLVLEPFARRHSGGVFELWSSPEVCLHSGEAVGPDGRAVRLPARSPAESDPILEFFIDRARRGTGVRWAVLRRSDGGFVGAVGCNAFEPPELAYHLHPGFWGMGVAREACQAVIGWLREGRGGGTAIEALIEPENLRSVALARRLGFVATAETRDGARRHRLEGAA